MDKRFDYALAAVLTVATQIEVWTNDGVESPFAVQVVSFLLITVPLAWRRTSPLVAAGVVSLGFAAQVIAAGDAPVLGGLVAAIVLTYSAGAYLRGRQAVVGVAFITLGLIVAALWDEDKRSLSDTFGNVLIFAVIWALGRAVSTRQRRAEALEVTARESEERARAAAAEERGRIARELHDVIAHNVSVMVLQAGAARQVLDRDPERVREPLYTIERSGREAIEEMRRLLGILRANGGPLSLSPQPSLDDLDDLADNARRNGIDVDIRRADDGAPLPAGLELTAYRIVQEALTNSIKHSGGSSATVTVRRDEEGLVVDVVDDGARSGGQLGTGHGLIGMRERVAVYGGRLEAGTAPDGGFRVTAHLPTGGVGA